MAYPKDDPARGVPASPNLPAVEERVLGHWDTDGTFKESIARRSAGPNGEGEFVFYDGPPFANGLPHYGHLLTGYVKDIVPRYQTMRGKRVERRFGWDCHGLPAEVEAEKQLGISTKAEVEALGLEKFNAITRESVLKYTKDWERYVTRQARWVDFDNDYKTLDLDYMESVMWAFKSLYDKGLIYEGFRVLWYCTRCETPLSNTETKMDDTYRDRQDPAVTVTLPLVAPGSDLDGVNALVWTTTPWTLPSNLAAAVHPDVEYVVVEHEGQRYLLAEARVAAYARELGEEPPVVGRYTGRELAGLRYRPPFDFFAGRDNAHQVLLADYVTTDDGTGMVHIAPAFGEEDKVVTDAADIEAVVPVNAQGRFTEEVPPYEGQHVFEANKPIIRDLKESGRLLRHDTYVHSYPHCWRCDTPLIQRALSSWFVKVVDFRGRMLELNQQIAWTPSHIKDGQFGKWLEGARDWNISRNRFWGSPIPVWVSDNPDYPRMDVYGSLDQLEADFGVRPTDLHRPAIDELTRPNPDDPTGQSTMRRVPEVLDCWFESGAMPFAQVHYPFENRDWFEHHYPGDFIVEYSPQTRGWFYTMHVLATSLFDRPAFKSCVVHGTLLGEDGRKMSKSLRNYPDVYEVFDSYGADAMRWFLCASPVLRGGDMPVTEAGIRDTVRQVVLPLWNVWYFFSLYANAEGYETTPDAAETAALASDNVLDRYVLSKTRELVDNVRESMDAYDVSRACEHVRFYLDALTNWYVRRSRERFWTGDRSAFDTLSTVLRVVCETAAPLLPLITDDIWRGLTGDSSVHLADYPDATVLPQDHALVAAMDATRDVCSAALSLRKATKLRVRLPLASLTVATVDADSLREFVSLIADEVNVKEVVFTADVSTYCDQTLSVVPRVLGPRLGKDVQRVIKAVKSGDWSVTDDVVTAGGVTLQEGEYELTMTPRSAERTAILPGKAGVVVLDTEVTPELAAEGLARDVVRVVQNARKEADLVVTDRISLTLDTPAEVTAAVKTHEEFVKRETLTTALEFAPVTEGTTGEAGDGLTVKAAVAKA
ncbi:isoleucine--tRNA ligase [Stackebrandtia nassauensis]|uniref:Isoleucine--tRNA ligase n=1 Tax=Stackebrandtia nassauensis (strain DSM 44728 / CIP 108903 / NRRL B-16338 / NBRC 102104 / LLR-40K-21) TaxID=446470 RepID=D3Q702_STANL|nr:isoleucine--tRNA ligase [Stackebrandtia nassauensis]ADD40401.1 isoleucyl-tRNA synthetase [Stackebrandtia nassauensis DSM 44728]